MTTPFVEYGFANGSANSVRPTEVSYPDGRELALDYGSAGSMADALSRVGSIIDDDNTHLADYAYLGERSFVTSDLAQPDVKWTLASLTGTNDPDTGDIYTGLDRFGRVKDNRWYDYGASADADRIKYGYDRAGNRTWRQNTVADAQGKHFDELYGNDLIHRLKELARGTFNGQKDGRVARHDQRDQRERRGERDRDIKPSIAGSTRGSLQADFDNHASVPFATPLVPNVARGVPPDR